MACVTHKRWNRIIEEALDNQLGCLQTNMTRTDHALSRFILKETSQFGSSVVDVDCLHAFKALEHTHYGLKLRQRPQCGHVADACNFLTV